MATPRESRAEIQRILEDFTRGSIDFQSLLTELDQTFQVDESARTVALELVDQLDPNGALQRGFFRVLKDRIEQNLATGAPIPIVSHPRSAHAVDAVLQKDLPLDERTVPFGPAAAKADPDSGADSTDQATQEDEAESLGAALRAGATVPLRTPLPEETPSVAEPESLPPPMPPAESAVPPPEPPAFVPAAKAVPAPPPPAPESPASVRPRAGESARPGTSAPVAGPRTVRDRPFVTERRVVTPPKRGALSWIGGIIVIGLMVALVLLGPLRDYLPQLTAYAVTARQEIAALFETQEPTATAPQAQTAQPATETPSATAPIPTTEPAPGDATPAPQSAENPSAATSSAEIPAVAEQGTAERAQPQAESPATSASAQPPAPGATPAPTGSDTTTTEPQMSPPARNMASAAAAAPAAKTNVAAAPTGPGRFTFASRSYRIREDAGMVALRIERRDGSAGAASVSWWTIPDTASPEEDYADFGARVESFSDGETARTIYVPIASDDIAEDEETFEVQLGEPSAGAALGATATATITIVDDDL